VPANVRQRKAVVVLPVGVVAVDDYGELADVAAKCTERPVQREKHAVGLLGVVQPQESFALLVVLAGKPVQQPGPI